MNYLAHAYLSGSNPGVVTGNVVADSIKGKQYLRYPEDMRSGVLLHRKIDAFTDSAEETKSCKSFFREDFGLYSGIVVDVLFDHLLARNFEKITGKNLPSFSAEVYDKMSLYESHLPDSWKPRFTHMKTYDWLSGYAYREAIEKSFEGLNKRIYYRKNLREAIPVFLNNIEAIEALFMIFWKKINENITTFDKEITLNSFVDLS